MYYVSVKTEAECNFDQKNTCNFQVDIGGTLSWKIQQGFDAGPNVQRPQYDSTKMSNSKFQVSGDLSRTIILSFYFIMN